MMTNDLPILIALPQELADELIANGGARRKIASQRSVSADTILLSVGAASAVVGLLQTPTTIRDLASLIKEQVVRHKTSVPLATAGPGELEEFTVSSETDAEQLEHYLKQVLSQNLAAEVVIEIREPETEPAGWYHAEGDPKGTVRYWDGALWHGEPK